MSVKMIWGGSGKDNVVKERNRVSSFRGYLYKLRRSKNLLAPQWGKRWITIEGHFLKWYRNESDISPSGMVDLKYIRGINKVEDTPNTFAITSEDRTLVLKCASKADMQNWIRAMHIQADIARGGKGMTVVSDFNNIPLDFSSIRYSSGPRNRKSTTTLTLEKELDLTLQKLEQLEQEALASTDDFVEEKVEMPAGNKNGHSRSNSLNLGVGTGSNNNSDKLSKAGMRASREGSRERGPGEGAIASTTMGSVWTDPNPPSLPPRGPSTRITVQSQSDDLEDSTDSLPNDEVVVRVPRTPQRGPSTGGVGRGFGEIGGDSPSSIEDISWDTKSPRRAKSIQMKKKGLSTGLDDTPPMAKHPVPLSPDEETFSDLGDSPAGKVRAGVSELTTESVESEVDGGADRVRAIPVSRGSGSGSGAGASSSAGLPPRMVVNKQKSLRSAW